MTWLLAIFAGAVIGASYCALLWLAIDRAVDSMRWRGKERKGERLPDSSPLPSSPSWFVIASLARVALVVSLFFGLIMLGHDIALWALVGFVLMRGGVAWSIGGRAYGN